MAGQGAIIHFAHKIIIINAMCMASSSNVQSYKHYTYVASL